MKDEFEVEISPEEVKNLGEQLNQKSIEETAIEANSTYHVVLRCINCKQVIPVDIPKGVLIKVYMKDFIDDLCPNCGCINTIVMGE